MVDLFQQKKWMHCGFEKQQASSLITILDNNLYPTMPSDDIYILSFSSASSITTSSIVNVSSSLSSCASSITTSSNVNVSSSLSSCASSLSSSPNGNISSLLTSPSPTSTLSNENISSSSSSKPIQYSSDRIYYLLRNEKQYYDIIDNKSSSALGLHWITFGFPARFNTTTGIFERIVGFTSCRKCKKTFVYGQHSGTSHMKQHSCVNRNITASASTSTESDKTQSTIDKMMIIHKTLTTEQSNTIKDLIARWICSDIRPISIIEDDGLRLLIQECVRLGSIYGNIDVNDLLRGRTTISSHIQTVAKSCRERIKELLKEPYNNGCLSISPDFWCDKYKQISYLGVTAVIVDQDCKYYTIDLCCKPFQEYEKTGENILIALKSEMKLFGIDDLSKVTIVCDRASNFLKAFRHLNPITCYAHRLNNILKRSFFQHQKQTPTPPVASINDTSSSDEDDEFDVPTKPLKTNINSNIRTKSVKEKAMTMKLIDTPSATQQLIKTIVECKSLAKYIKKAGLNKEVQEAGGCAIRQAIVIRWLSLINLLESVDLSFLQLKVVQNRRKQQQKWSGINQYLVKQIVRLLKPFESIIKMIQSGSNPTLYLVLPSTLSIRKILNSWTSVLQHMEKTVGEIIGDYYDDRQENEGVTYVRERILTLLNSMVELDIRHYCATTLHPDYRSLRGCSNDERIACYSYIREQMKSISIEQNENNEELQKKKRFKSEHLSILEDFKDNPSSFDDDDFNDDNEFDDNADAKSVEYPLPITQSDELSRYLSMKIDMQHFSSNVLTFWKSNVNELPRLSKLARQVHSIPATSAAIERQFSIAGLTLTDRRTSLDPEQLDNMLCIRAIAKLENRM